MKKYLFALSMLLFGVGIFTSSHAALITVDFTGTVNTVGNSIAGDGVTVGDSITGRFTYDTLAADSDPSADYGNYVGVSFDIMFGSSFSASSGNTSVYVQNDTQNGSATNPADGMTVLASAASGGSLNGRAVEAYQFGLRKENLAGHLWHDDNLPDLADWSLVTLTDINAPGWHWMQFDRAGDASIFDSQIRWEITSFNAVPVPPALILLGTGLIAIIGGRKKLFH